MENFIIIAVIVCIVVCAARSLWRAKKRGEACIGCSGGKQCCGKCGGNEKH